MRRKTVNKTDLIEMYTSSMIIESADSSSEIN